MTVGNFREKGKYHYPHEWRGKKFLGVLGPRSLVDSKALLLGLPPICLFVDFILRMMFGPLGAVSVVLTPQARLWIPKGCHRTSGALVQQSQGWWWYNFQLEYRGKIVAPPETR